MRSVAVESLSTRSRRVCAVHFAVAAVANVVAGLASVRFALRANAEQTVVWALTRVFGRGTALDWGPGVIASLVTAVGVLGVALLCVGAVQSLAALYSLRGRRRRVRLFAGGVGVATVVSLPWSAVGASLAFLDADRFDRRTPPGRPK